jgi:hypothetical protein
VKVRNIVLRTALNGWQFSGITSFISGAPLSVGFTTTTSIDITGSPDLAPRINVNGDPNLSKDQQTFSRVFNTSVFSLPAVGTIGNAGRWAIRGPGVNNSDISLSKTVPIRERLQLQLRLEAYNAFNHTQFTAVNTSAQFNPATGQQTNAAFGQYTAAANPRQVQLAVKVRF